MSIFNFHLEFKNLDGNRIILRFQEKIYQTILFSINQ